VAGRKKGAGRARLLMVQGTSSGAGKSTIVAGLCRLFSSDGYRVAPFKSQNMSSNLYQTANGLKMARAQAVQAVAAGIEPDERMNPILLKPIGDYRSEVFVDGRFYSEMHAQEYYGRFAVARGLPIALRALDSLRRENDIVVMEGAGSPAEVNIARFDIANMLLAEKVRSPVIIVADIERGGCFASIVGTMQLLKPRRRALVRGFLINKFRGDPSLLELAIKTTEKLTRKRILGVVPKIELQLPDEDSLDGARGLSPEDELPQESWGWQADLLAKTIKESVDVERLYAVAGLK